MKHYRVLLLAALLTVRPTIARAQVMTFEGFADATALTNQLAGLTFQQALILKAGVSLNDTEFPPKSGVNVVTASAASLQMTFTDVTASFLGYFTYTDGITVSAFDASNNLLATKQGLFTNNYVSSGNAPNEQIRIDVAGIKRVVVTGEFTMDDAQFTTTAPEPSTTLMLAAGLVVLAAVGARRRTRI